MTSGTQARQRAVKVGNLSTGPVIVQLKWVTFKQRPHDRVVKVEHRPHNGAVKVGHC